MKDNIAFKKLFGEDIEEEEDQEERLNDPPTFVDEQDKESVEQEEEIKKIETPQIFQEEYSEEYKKEHPEEFMEEKTEEDKENNDKEESNDVENEDSDYDFDFSIYEDDEESVSATPRSVVNYNVPNVLGYRFKYSHGFFELERLGQLKLKLSTYSIRAAAYKQDLNMLWEYYGILRTTWNLLRPVFGKHLRSEFDNLTITAREKLRSVKHNQRIPDDVFESLINFDSYLQQLMQLNNIGFEVEKIRGGTRAEQRIKQ